MAVRETNFLVAQMSGFFNKVIARFQATGGTKDQILFYDNSDSKFTFDKAPPVDIVQIATTVNETTAAKAAMRANVALYGRVLVNARTKSIERLNANNSTWAVTTADYFTVLKPGRIYVSTWSSRAWLADKYGELTRLMTNGLTDVG